MGPRGVSRNGSVSVADLARGPAVSQRVSRITAGKLQDPPPRPRSEPANPFSEWEDVLRERGGELRISGRTGCGPPLRPFSKCACGDCFGGPLIGSRYE